MSIARSPIEPDLPSLAVSLHRESIADMAYKAAIFAQHAADYAALGDDRGLQRSLRMLAICAAHAASALPALAQAVEADDRLRQSARAACPPKRRDPAEILP